MLLYISSCENFTAGNTDASGQVVVVICLSHLFIVVCICHSVAYLMSCSSQAAVFNTAACELQLIRYATQ